MHVRCPGCRRAIELEPHEVGATVECAVCGRRFGTNLKPGAAPRPEPPPRRRLAPGLLVALGLALGLILFPLVIVLVIRAARQEGLPEGSPAAVVRDALGLRITTDRLLGLRKEEVLRLLGREPDRRRPMDSPAGKGGECWIFDKPDGREWFVYFHGNGRCYKVVRTVTSDELRDLPGLTVEEAMRRLGQPERHFVVGGEEVLIYVPAKEKKGVVRIHIREGRVDFATDQQPADPRPPLKGPY